MVATALSLIFSGSLALLAGGGAHAVTKSHYQRKIRALEARLREVRAALRRCEDELALRRDEVERLRAQLVDRERRLGELAASIAALRDLTVDLDRRLQGHDTFLRRALAALTLRLGEHAREGEVMLKRQVRAQRSLDGFSREETGLQGQVLELRGTIADGDRQVEAAEEQVRERVSEEQTCEEELRTVVGA